ncbi:AAA family ATPase [Flavobacterium sasangense]|uniref:AAA family ATPase n=1 Tax=Flavobacterium sasangense TaxID=503361 RepID=UPI00047D5139|nr:ATP-binding protein [Flavobacterium sasangense]
MIKNISISNYKSIVKQDIDLGRVNVFIGENGSGKSNVLEAVAMLAASKCDELTTEKLFNRGVRVTKPSLTFNSFLKHKLKKKSIIELENLDGTKIKSVFINDNPDDIYSKWIDEENLAFQNTFLKLTLKHFKSQKDLQIDDFDDFERFLSNKYLPSVNRNIFTDLYGENVLDYVIYNINSNALRGISSESKREYLGIFGEGLDVLLSTFSDEQLEELMSYNFISWLEEIKLDGNDLLKYKGHKLGRSNSNLYFTDRFMKRNNKLFSAENANEGALHILFYLALFISEKTPKFFAIDNIETALNPKLCRDLIASIVKLSSSHDKQVLITTHNPAVLDGINLFDENQKLFVVKRADDGQTIVEPIKFKPSLQDSKFKLSELWMRGYLGGLSNSNF